MHQARDLGTTNITPSALLTSIVMSSAAPIGSAPSNAPTLPSSVSVSTKQLADELLVYEIAATVGAHVETQRHSIGVGGTNPSQPAPMSSAGLQAWLDDKRQIVADNAVWHVAMEDAAAQVK